MKRADRWGVLLAILLILPTFFLPMWRIQLTAPQYPEGLEMQIWFSRIIGDIGTINDLNHYIGMKKILPDEIPELKFLTPLILSVVIMLLLVFLFRKKWLLLISYIYFLCMAVYGFYDFWSWEYDYGHHLDPRAAIKIPGMNYQPPLIGYKQLLNFTSYSYPAAGGILLMASGMLLFLIVCNEFIFHKKSNHAIRKHSASARSTVAAEH